MFTSTKCLFAASFLVSFGAASSAAVGDVRLNENGVPAMEVAYADLNLGHADGQRKLEARIERAAKKVCGYRWERRSLLRLYASGIDACSILWTPGIPNRPRSSRPSPELPSRSRPSQRRSCMSPADAFST